MRPDFGLPIQLELRLLSTVFWRHIISQSLRCFLGLGGLVFEV